MVPGGQAVLKKQLQPSAGHVADIQRRRAQTPEIAAPAEQLPGHPQGGGDELAVVERGAHAEDALGQGALADMDGLAVEPCAAVSLRGEHFVLVGVVDNAVFYRAFPGQGHRNSALFQAADEVCGAVDGVHDKRPALQRVGVLLFLFAVENRTGLQGRELFFQKIFHRHVIFGHQVRGGALLMGVGPDVLCG